MRKLPRGKCKQCGTQILCKKVTAKFCSQPCYWKNLNGSTQKKRGPMPEWHKDRVREGLKGVFSDEKNPRWKGDGVGYGGIHIWIQRKLGTPDTCEHCKKSGLSRSQIQWANKSQKYLRDLSDWMRLCVSCHRKYDSGLRKEGVKTGLSGRASLLDGAMKE